MKKNLFVIFFEQISFISNTHYHFFKRGVIFSSQDYFTFGENIIWNLWQAFGESFPHLDFPSQKVCDINGTVYHDWISRIKGGKESGSFFQSANCKKCYFCSLSWFCCHDGKKVIAQLTGTISCLGITDFFTGFPGSSWYLYLDDFSNRVLFVFLFAWFSKPKKYLF